jgi:hypothetical protein
MRSSRLTESFPQRLQAPLLFLGRNTPIVSTLRRLCGSSFLTRDRDALDQEPQPLQRVLPISLLRSVLLCLDGDDPLRRDSVITQRE